MRWFCGALIAGCSLLTQVAARPSHPYLAVASPLPLRFAPPPPERGTEPTPVATIRVGPVVDETPLSPTEPLTGSVGETASLPLPPATPEQPEADAPADSPRHEHAPTTPPAILPDDLSQRTTAEDFLPYFLPPRLPSAPPSQATYQQR